MPANSKIRSKSTNSTTSAKDETTNPCGKCKKNVFNQDHAVECELCDRWYHIKCENIEESVYEAIGKGATGLHWFCNHCNTVALKFVTAISNIEKKQEKMESKIEKMELEVNNQDKQININKNEIDKVNIEIESVKATVTNIQKKSEETPETKINSNTQDETITEINDRRQREPNLIIFNLDERETNIKEEIIKEDIKNLKEICEIIDKEINIEPEILKLTRLGKKQENKIRPLHIQLKEKEKKRPIFRNLKNLKDSKFSKISVVHDLTVKERDEEKKKWLESKHLNENQGGEWIFKIRGPPWARKIIRMKKQ